MSRAGLLTLMLAVMACGTREATQRPGERATLRIVTQSYMNFSMFHIGKADSIFQRHGIDVEWVPVQNSTESLPLLLNGTVDVLPASLQPGMYNAMARGDDLRIVADRGYLPPGDCTTLALLRSTAGTPKRAGGRLRASLERGPSMVYVAEAMLASAGVDVATVERVDIPHAPEMDALSKGSIDVSFSGEPWVTRNVRSGSGTVWVRAQDVLPNHQMSVVLFGRRLLRDDRALGERFMTAYREAVAVHNQGATPHNVAIVAAATRDDPDVIRAACWIPVQPSLRINLASVLQQQSWMVAKGLVTSPASAAQIWDSSFVVSADTATQQLRGR